MFDSTGGIQHGGDHYKGMKIQPIDYAEENNLTATEFSVIKYTSRHRHREGMKDLKKAFHFLQMLARRFYGWEVTVEFKEPIDQIKQVEINQESFLRP